MFQGAYLVKRHHISIICERIGHGNIYRNMIRQPEFFHIFIGDEANLIDIRIINTHEYRPGEFLFVSCKRFEEIFDRGIDEFYTGCPFQPVVKQTEYPAGYEVRTQITYYNQGYNNYNKPQAIVLIGNIPGSIL